MHSHNLINVIREGLNDLNKSEHKVASAILDDPDRVTRASIATLARWANVSEPSVNRFCKRFATAGFPDFKLKLAQSLVSGLRFMNKEVQASDDVTTYTPKIFDCAINDLVRMRDQIDAAQIEEVVTLLTETKQIHFFGLGASASVAKDAENKFFRFDIPVSCQDDILMQRMLASAGDADDTFFIISHTGRTKELVAVADIARNNGSAVIGLTPSNSPLAQVCSITLNADVPENTDEYMPMTSRIVHLVILDVLATGVTLKLGPKLLTHLGKIKHSLKATRFKAPGDE